jgi:hypothetical protein
MLLRLFRRFFHKRKTQSANDPVSLNVLPEKAKHGVLAAARKPEWVEVLTQSLKENALAPSEEVILHAFDLYCDELNAPFVERRHAMNGHLSDIVASFAKVQALAPDMVERAAAKHKLELHRFIDKKDDF